MDDGLIENTTRIATAYLTTNTLQISQIPELLSSISGALTAISSSGQPVEDVHEPAVTRRQAVQRDHVACMECGKRMKMLRRHLHTEHDLSVAEYRLRYSLPEDFPMVAPNYAAKRRELAKQAGLGRNPQQRRGRLKKVA